MAMWRLWHSRFTANGGAVKDFFGRVVSRHDLRHRLVIDRNYTLSLPAGADPTSYRVSILTGRITCCGMYYLFCARGEGADSCRLT